MRGTMMRVGARMGGGAALVLSLLAPGGVAGGEPVEALGPPAVAVTRAPSAERGPLRALFDRIWARTDLAPWRPVGLTVIDGLAPNAVATPRMVVVSRDYLRWVDRLPGAVRERVVARTLAHELAHVALGHGLNPSPRAELDAEALGIQYFELAGFDCRWWVEYVRSAEEPDGRRGWPALHEVIDHDTQACARVRALLGHDTPEVAERP